MVNLGGRPLKFKSVKELQTKIDGYFNSCFAPKIIKVVNDSGRGKPMRELKQSDYELVPEKDENGNLVYEQVKPFTITGLALFLNTSRQTLINYEKKDKFFDTIKKAKDKCEEYVEDYLFTGKNVAGAIFNLKNNYEWEERQTIQHSGLSNLLEEINTSKDSPIKQNDRGTTEKEPEESGMAPQ